MSAAAASKPNWLRLEAEIGAFQGLLATSLSLPPGRGAALLAVMIQVFLVGSPRALKPRGRVPCHLWDLPTLQKLPSGRYLSVRSVGWVFGLLINKQL